MKLRIHGNSVRLRLNRSETRALGAGRKVEVCLPSAPQPLVYRVEAADVARIVCTFAQGEMNVRVPSTRAREWADGSEVGMESETLGLDGSALKIQIEKDFQCLHGEEAGQEDCFPNPVAGGKHILTWKFS